MLEKIYIKDPKNTDLNMYRCGIEDCSSGHSWGPAIRDHYIVHYILGGKGTFHVDGKVHRLEKNDGFLICPNKIVYYQADFEEPWSYAWVGFNGFKAGDYLNQAGLNAANPIFNYAYDTFLKDCLARMIETKDQSKGREIRLMGLLYEFLARLIETSAGDNQAKGVNRKEEYIKKALEYIQMNYSRKISISEIAGHIGLDRSYLYSLFTEYLKSSPQQFLISFRLEKACELMRNSSLSIGDVSRSVGYEDPLLFSKIFKREKGMSPKEFRKQL